MKQTVEVDGQRINALGTRSDTLPTFFFVPWIKMLDTHNNNNFFLNVIALCSPRFSLNHFFFQHARGKKIVRLFVFLKEKEK
jgi:hypothetical protein